MALDQPGSSFLPGPPFSISPFMGITWNLGKTEGEVGACGEMRECASGWRDEGDGSSKVRRV